MPSDTIVEGKTTKIFNSVAPSRDGKIYYTDSSTNYYLDEALGELLGAPSGRLLVFDPETNESIVLKDQIHFTNGLVLSPEEDYLIFAETLKSRLHKYWIKGPKSGKYKDNFEDYFHALKSTIQIGMTEIFMEGLPGSPDNLNFSPDGNILVTLVTVRLPERFDADEFMYLHPWIRKTLLRILHILKIPINLATTYLDLPITKKMEYHVITFDCLVM